VSIEVRLVAVVVVRHGAVVPAAVIQAVMPPARTHALRPAAGTLLVGGPQSPGHLGRPAHYRLVALL
jgi:hypothetical protein